MAIKWSLQLKNHYSLFRFQDPDGLTRIINLDAISHISIEPSQCIDSVSYWVFMLDGESIMVGSIEGEALLKAWNIFLSVKHSQHHVLTQVDTFGCNPQAVNSGLRLEKFLLDTVTLAHQESELCQ